MKKTFKRVLAVFLLVAFVLSSAPIAGAEWSSDDNWDIVGIAGVYMSKPKEYIPLDMMDVIKGAKYFEAYSSDETVVRIDDPESLEGYATGEGVAIITIYEYDKHHNYLGCEQNIAAISKRRCKGTINESYIDDITVNYKSNSYMPEAAVYSEGDVDYWNYYITLSGDIYVDNTGHIETYNTGSSTVACVSIATNGSASIALSNVTVKYSFGQWLIRIFLFGWLWY